jgi:hypothetical protein
MNYSDPLYEDKLNKLNLMLYLIPVVGWVPSIWSLYQRQGNREQQSISRLSVSLSLCWLISYIVLQTSSSFTPEAYTLRLLYLNGLLTSAYIWLSLGLIWRLWQGKLIRFSN